MKAGRHDWLADAACGDVKGFTEAPPAEQKVFCKSCPVQMRCLQLGMEIDAEYADVPPDTHRIVFGGLTLSDRRRLRIGKADAA